MTAWRITDNLQQITFFFVFENRLTPFRCLNATFRQPILKANEASVHKHRNVKAYLKIIRQVRAPAS
jgi:hypothetical protein